MNVLLFDNNDSFTANIRQYVRECGADCDSIPTRNSDISKAAHYDAIIFSPGPGLPQDFPEMFSVLESFHATKPILGICLGHQAIAQYYGGSLYNLSEIFHGEQIILHNLNDEVLFSGFSEYVEVGVYHSWAVNWKGFPAVLTVTSTAKETGIIQSIRHNEYDIRGVQFHPESILTPNGKKLLSNWIQRKKEVLP